MAKQDLERTSVDEYVTVAIPDDATEMVDLSKGKLRFQYHQQNSVNEEMETVIKNQQADSTSPLIRQSPTLDFPFELRQASPARTGTQFKTCCTCQGSSPASEYTQSGSSFASDCDMKRGKGLTWGAILKMLVVGLIVMLLLAGVGFVFYSFRGQRLQEDFERPYFEHGHFDAVVAEPKFGSRPVWGRFTFNQSVLFKDHVQLYKSKDIAVSPFLEPISYAPCVGARATGMYKIYSQLTYQFTDKTTENAEAHSIVIRRGPKEVEEMELRRVTPVPKFSGPGTVLQTSAISVLSQIRAGDKICVMANSKNIYISAVDNLLDIELRYEYAPDAATTTTPEPRPSPIL